MIRLIAAVSQNNIIGKDNKLPWFYPADLKWFKKQTRYGTVIMGKNTWASFGGGFLKDRLNFVVSKSAIKELCGGKDEDMPKTGVLQVKDAPLIFVDSFDRIKSHIAESRNHIWFMGGHKIYEEGMALSDEILLTEIPEEVHGDNLVQFPLIDMTIWKLQYRISDENDRRLKHVKYVRIIPRKKGL